MEPTDVRRRDGVLIPTGQNKEVLDFAMATQEPAQAYVEEVLGPLAAAAQYKAAGSGQAPQVVVDAAARLGAMVQAFPSIVTTAVASAGSIDDVQLDPMKTELGRMITDYERRMPWWRPELRELKEALTPKAMDERIFLPALEQNGGS